MERDIQEADGDGNAELFRPSTFEDIAREAVRVLGRFAPSKGPPDSAGGGCGECDSRTPGFHKARCRWQQGREVIRAFRRVVRESAGRATVEAE